MIYGSLGTGYILHLNLHSIRKTSELWQLIILSVVMGKKFWKSRKEWHSRLLFCLASVTLKLLLVYSFDSFSFS